MGVGAKCQGNPVNVNEWVQSAWKMQGSAGECQGNGGEWRGMPWEHTGGCKVEEGCR